MCSGSDVKCEGEVVVAMGVLCDDVGRGEERLAETAAHMHMIHSICRTCTNDPVTRIYIYMLVRFLTVLHVVVGIPHQQQHGWDVCSTTQHTTCVGIACVVIVIASHHIISSHTPVPHQHMMSVIPSHSHHIVYT